MNFNFQKNGFLKTQILNKPVIHTENPIDRILEQRKTHREAPTKEPTPVLPKEDLQRKLQTLRELRK